MDRRHDAIIWICGLLIFVFFAAVAVGGYYGKKHECEDAGGEWLPKSQLCLRK